MCRCGCGGVGGTRSHHQSAVRHGNATGVRFEPLPQHPPHQSLSQAIYNHFICQALYWQCPPLLLSCNNSFPSHRIKTPSTVSKLCCWKVESFWCFPRASVSNSRQFDTVQSFQHVTNSIKTFLWHKHTRQELQSI